MGPRRGALGGLSIAAAVGIVAASAQLAGAQTEAAAEVGPLTEVVQAPGSWQTNQDRLLALADEITALVDPKESGTTSPVDADTGYLTLTISPAQDRLDLYWAGTVPPSIQELISEHRDVEVETHVVAFSQDDYLAEQDRIVEAVTDEQVLGEKAQLVSVMHSIDRSSFIITVYDPSGELTAETARATLQELTDVPVSVDMATNPTGGAPLAVETTAAR
ncbi:MAG: hypothetical protein QM602_05015 [Microbacterium sp.]